MADLSTEWVVLARLLRPQGRKGELLADMLTDFPARFEPGSKVYLVPPDFSGSPSDARSLAISSSWLPHGRNHGRIVLGFAGIDSIDEAQRVSGMELVVAPSDRFPLVDGSVYVDSLVGCEVYDHETLIGTVKDVQFMTTPDGKRRLEDAASLLVVDGPFGEILVPFAKDLLSSVDVEQKSIRMELPEGLRDLNGGLAGASSESQRESE